MRVFKASYKSKSGQLRKTSKWYVEFRDHLETIRRIPGYTDKNQTIEFGRKIDKLVACRGNGEPPTPDLARWIEMMPAPAHKKLAEIGLLEAEHGSRIRLLLDHANDFKSALAAKNNTARHVSLTASRLTAVINGCGFKTWSDVREDRVLNHLASLRNAGKGISAQTSNFYLQAFKQFCSWMVRNRRASQSPVEFLQGLNVRTDRRHDRRPLTFEEMRWLLHVTTGGSDRGKATGPERALVYRVAAETGLRGSELHSLTKSSFTLEGVGPHVKVAAADSKHRRDDLVPLKASTVSVLLEHLRNKTPSAPAFRMPSRNLWARVIKFDLEAARKAWLRSAPTAEERAKWENTDFLKYKDAKGRYADFHSLRHVTGSFLAAANVSPKVAQSILRHSNIALTLNTYSHAFQNDQMDAVGRLPDLSELPPGIKRADPKAS